MLTDLAALPAPVLAWVAALAAACLGSLGLAALLLWRARNVPIRYLLVLFLLGVAGWSLGQALPVLLGPAAERATDLLVALAPLPSAAFLHLVFAFVRCGAVGPVARIGYGVAVPTVLLGLVTDPGGIAPWRDFPGIYRPGPTGWFVLAVCAGLSVVGHLRLAQGWWQGTGQRRRQAGAMFLSSLIGLVSLTGFASPALGIDAFPWPVLALPLYSVVLVYGVLRYQLMDVNLWARKLVVWLLLTGLLALGSALVAALPLALGGGGGAGGFWGAWAGMAATLLLALAILTPLRRLADRMVFPGAAVRPEERAAWRAALAGPLDRAGLEQTAAALIGRRLGVPMAVRLSPTEEPDQGPAVPAILLQGRSDGRRVVLQGWEDAPPGPRFAAELFAADLDDAVARLERAEALATQERLRERERQQAARMAELGELAAIVAHELRNPLNIVSMAAAGAPAEVRKEIAEQLARMNLLVSDILDYARNSRPERRVVPLRAAVAQAACALPALRPELQIAEDLTVSADPRRLQQVLGNLLDNAAAQASRVAVIAESLADGGIALHVCDDGPGVPPDLRDRLFRPFVSRRPGGTGLGLAIVARIMEAHGGSAALEQRPGWSTCITLRFPAEAAS